MGLIHLHQAFRLLNLKVPEQVASDISLRSIREKITNPALAQALGARKSPSAIRLAEWCVNLLDSYSESKNETYLDRADVCYQKLLRSLPPKSRPIITDAMATMFNFFVFEQFVVERHRRGDRLSRAELTEYLLRRGSDSILYGLLLQELDGINHPHLISGMRVRQALWDIADDILDLDEDRRTGKGNLLIFSSSPREIWVIAEGLRHGVIDHFSINHPLYLAINKELDRVGELLPS